MADDAATFRRIPLEIFNEGNLDLIDELLTEDYVEHAAPPGAPQSREALREYVAELRRAFPDFRYEILQQVDEGDTHVGYIRGTGTMKGDFMGMPASGKRAGWEEIHIARFGGGRMAEHWAVVDRLHMLEDLGFVSPPGT